MDDMPWPPAVSPSPEYDHEEVMAAIDDVDSVSRLVIADVSRDESWISAPMEASVSLKAVR